MQFIHLLHIETISKGNIYNNGYYNNFNILFMDIKSQSYVMQCCQQNQKAHLGLQLCFRSEGSISQNSPSLVWTFLTEYNQFRTHTFFELFEGIQTVVNFAPYGKFDYFTLR